MIYVKHLDRASLPFLVANSVWLCVKADSEDQQDVWRDSQFMITDDFGNLVAISALKFHKQAQHVEH